MKFPHQTYIQKNDIDIADLPADLREAISDFDSKMEDYEIAEEDDEPDARAILDELKEISSSIVKEIKEYEEEEEVAEEEETMPPSTGKKEILQWLYENGVREVTKDMLKKYGYPTGFASNLTELGERVSGFELKKEIREKTYKLIKL